MKKPSGRIEDLTPEERRSLLARLFARRGAKTKNYRASFAQERLWFLDRLRPGDPAFLAPTLLRFDGQLDSDVLERSLREIVRRHDALRTTFPAPDGQPLQEVRSEVRLDFRRVDLRLAGGERGKSRRELLLAEARRPFDLARGPLVRALLLRVAEREHELLLMIHHIVYDALSVRVLADELKGLYEAFVGGQVPRLPELPLQYGEFAHLQRSSLDREELRSQIAYWVEKLEGVPRLELPTDRPRPTVLATDGAKHRIVLSGELATGLAELGLGTGCTLFTVLLAAFQTLLLRYTAQTDVAVGVPISNRAIPGTEALIGFFVNSLVLRGELSGNPRFREVLGRLRETVLDAFEHAELPFELLIKELHPERDLGHNPLFQVMFNLQSAPVARVELPGVAFREIEFDPGTAVLDLTLTMTEAEGGLVATFEYRTDLFDAATIERMAEHWRSLLEGLVADPDQRLSELPILTPGERHRQLVEWNDTASELPSEETVHALFEARAREAPDAIAAVSGEREVSYGDLDRSSERWARTLRDLGVRTGVRVGLFGEASLERLAALVGIWKAGGVLVPLDPDLPGERIAFLMRDSDPDLVLVQGALRGQLAAHGCRLVVFDEADGIEASPCADAVERTVGGRDLAYVLYTSGSTGQPKGCVVRHRGLTNVAAEQARLLDAGAGSRVLQFASSSFDASIFELALALTTGATLCLAPRDELSPGPPLARTLRELEITHLTIPPTALAALPPGPLPALRTICVAGEACTGELVSLWARGRRFLNLYGPTEATIWTTYQEPVDERRPAVIGRPIRNTQVYVLDAYGEPVPVGVSGELHVGGTGVGCGYLDRPELTGERFVPDPFAGDDARLYRTGDRVRQLPDGRVEYLGRLDDQVKIRGIRIEPAEVGAALARHGAVKDALVLGRRGPGGESRLAAFVAHGSEPAPEAAELRRFLRASLPEAMIPSEFAFLEQLPRTPGGKVDREALPDPAATPTLSRATFVPPQTPLEARLAEIWAEVLGADRVGSYDNFFDLGGHSLLSTQLIARIEERLEVTLRPADVMLQTLGQLATTCETQLAADSKAAAGEGSSPDGGVA